MSDAKTTLGDLLRPKTAPQASFEAVTIMTLFLDFCCVYTSKRPIQKLLPGMEVTKRQPSKKHSAHASVQSKRNDKLRSLRRSEKSLKAIIRSNRFQWFVTFTFKADRQDIDKCKRKMNNWLKRVQRKYGKFEYVIVPEFHHDGVSIHFHALLTSYPGEATPALHPKTGKQIHKRGRPAFNFLDYRLGFTVATPIPADPDEQRAAGRYLLKYVTKSLLDFPEKRRYWPSRGLKRPSVLYNPTDCYSNLTPSWENENDYGRTVHYEYVDNSELLALRNALIDQTDMMPVAPNSQQAETRQ